MSATRLENDPALGLVHLTSVIANQSALPTKIGNETIGAAGASGAPDGDKGEACVKAGIDRITDQLKQVVRDWSLVTLGLLRPASARAFVFLDAGTTDS